MALNKYKLGEFIGLKDIKNTEGTFDLNCVKGISTQKVFIETKADMEGVTINSYKLVEPKSFAYVADTSRRGDKISLAYNFSKEQYLVSSISTVFYVIDEKALLPEYLYIYYNRPEFDRYCRFNSWGSAREAFSWEDMCDTDIELPDITIQQKYVDIYTAMIANQESYEQGLEDLKLTCDAYLDVLKKDKRWLPIKSILRELDNKNRDKVYTNVSGININKEFMSSVANTLESDLSKYKVVRKGEFVYSAMQTGRDEVIRIALYRENEGVVVSPAYSVLENSSAEVLSEFIMMWFSRGESDRKGWFYSDGSVRASLELERFFDIEIPIPPIETQKDIVAIFNAYNERKEINEKLKAMIKDICPILIKGSLDEGRKSGR